MAICHSWKSHEPLSQNHESGVSKVCKMTLLNVFGYPRPGSFSSPIREGLGSRFHQTWKNHSRTSSSMGYDLFKKKKTGIYKHINKTPRRKRENKGDFRRGIFCFCPKKASLLKKSKIILFLSHYIIKAL